MCRAFPMGLRGSARVWFNKLESESIGSFVQLSRAFIDHFIGSQRRGRPPTHLLSVKQMEGESLRAYVHRFNEEAMKIDRPKEDVTVTAFMAGLRKGDFLYDLCKDPPETMSKLMYEATKHMNAEDALEAMDDPPPKRQKDTKGSYKMTLHFGGQVRYVQILTADLKICIAGSTGITDISQEDCVALKEQVETLIRQGQGPLEKSEPSLEDWRPGGTSRASRKAYARQVHNIMVVQRPPKNVRLDDQIIFFSEEDARGTHQPHDDALVITINIVDFTTRRVMVDNGSSADILYLPAYQQMRLDKDKLRPMDAPLVGFTGDKVCPVGNVTLPIAVGTHPKTVSKTVDFLVVNCPSAYNAIIGRPTLNRLRALTSTYHLLLKFPTEYEIGEVRGDQVAARECYLASLGPEGQNQTMTIEEQKILVKPSEELDTIELEDGHPERTTKIRANLPPKMKESLVQFLKNNKDVFAWSHEDMPEEVFYPDWLANVVMVKKNTGKWRMCVDFTDLNKACPKDSFPLPRIDQLVDSTAGHKLLTFMDAFSGYNQIVMDESDQEKTSFITSRGLFCYKVMSFGLKNAGATYQRLMNRMFHDQIGRNVEVYIDDMLVKSKEEDGHLDDLRETFKTLRKYQMKLNPSKCAFGVYSGKFLGFMVSQRGIEANPDKIKAILEMQPSKTTKEVQRLTGRIAALNRFMSRSTDKCLPFFKTLKKAFVWTDECQQAFEELKRYLTEPPLLSLSKQGEELYLYLVVSPIAWSIELSEFDIDYRPRTAIKAQALANFIAEFTSKDDEPTEDVEQTSKWTVNIDGSSTRDSGGIGIVLKSPEGDIIKQAVRLQYSTTNNEAEYEALLARLKMAKILGATELDVLSDSQLVVGQVNGDYEAKEGPDQLAKSASSSMADDKIKIVKQSSLQTTEVNPVHTEISWMTPIISYLQGGILPDRHEARRCLALDEAKYVMREIHEGICGNHSGARALKKKIIRAGYYRPTMQADANRFVQHCDKCQRFANLLHSPPEIVTPMTTPWPFAQWGLDIMGPFPIGRRQLKFLVVAIDYFTKWVETEPLATITEKNIQNFVWKTASTTTTSSPGHPQANGQVEVTNRSLLKLIKTRLERAKGLWPEELTSILWAYRTTVRIPTGETPFRMTYGNEAVAPVEIGLTTLRIATYDDLGNEEQLCLNLDLIDEVRETVEKRMKRYQEKMA
uniref:Uncharacterized protein n=1 Tax=Fagus sylvatica TaxID=28930 RepID=A0A2N9GMR1_FAGSY